MFLVDTDDTLEAVLGAAATTTNPSFLVFFADITTSAFTPGKQTGALNGTTGVTIASAPAASTQRQIKGIHIFNADTVEHTVTVRFDDNGTERNLIQIAVAANSVLSWTPETGWTLDNADNAASSGGATVNAYFNGAMGDHGGVDGQLRATKGVAFNVRQACTITDVYGVIDPAANTDDYHFQLATLSSLTLDGTDVTRATAATVGTVLGTSSTVTLGSTLPRIARGNFSTPVQLAAGNHIAVAVFDQGSGTATARLHGGSSQPFHMAAPVDAYNGMIQFNTVNLSASQASTAVVNTYTRMWMEGTID